MSISSYRTMAMWTAKDVVFADNSTEDSPYLVNINNRLLLAYPEGEHHGFFTGVMPHNYTGKSLLVWFIGTNEDIVATKYVHFWASLQRHNLADPIETLSYGTEKGAFYSGSTSNYAAKVLGGAPFGMDFETAAERDNLAAGDMFTLRMRRDSAHAFDTINETAYLLSVQLVERYE